ncbi:hypothetical protein EG68_02166 [Paragonimus skrjabini miyazakii]|uniref:Uncharacterized protein n=1 Tax=Paragonimus skrjabini miyazakii TaxID=59628 RepID=A0A8S9Z5D2_9TREM|nr:hypothetical protein EG68_02166 [Paragonimus skrjabini miyazakii]
MSEFAGKWKLVEQENLDIMLSAFSVSEEQKKKLLNTMTIEYISVGPQQIRICSPLYFSPGEIDLTFGEEFDQTGIDGTMIKAIVEKPSDRKLVYTQKHPILRVVTTSEIKDGFNVMVISCLGMKATLKFQRIQVE